MVNQNQFRDVELEIVENANVVIVENPTRHDKTVNVENDKTTIIYAPVENANPTTFGFDKGANVVIYKMAFVVVVIVGAYIVIEVVEIIIAKIVRIAAAVADIAFNALRAVLCLSTIYALYKVFRYSSSTTAYKGKTNNTTTPPQHSTNNVTIIQHVEIKN